MTERAVEQRLTREVRQRIPGALCLKLVCPGNAGVPDRVILLPRGGVVFVELKRPGGKPRPLQAEMHDRLMRLGFRVFGCVDSYEAVDEVVRVCNNLVGERDHVAK